MMWYGVCGFVVTLFLIFAWQLRAKCRESAYYWAKWACREKNVQLLDQAVVWQKVRFKKNGRSYLLNWYFKFDYVYENTRHRGRVVVVGQYLQAISFSHERPVNAQITYLDDYRKSKYANKD